MIQKIIFLTAVKFGRRDLERFGIRTLKENGFEVGIWDISRVVYPRDIDQVVLPDEVLGEEIIRFASVRDLMSAFQRHNPGSLFICLFHLHTGTIPVYRALSRLELPYAVLYINSFPAPKRYYSAKGRLLHYISQVASPAVIRVFPAAINKLVMRYYRLFGIRPAHICLLGGRRSLDFFNSPVDSTTERVWLHSLDYDKYLQEAANPYVPGENTCVFIDTYFPTDPDRYYHRDVSVYNPDAAYYFQMRRFFADVEFHYGVRVVIAQHPKKQLDHDANSIVDFGPRAGISGDTAGLVRRSRFVLSHDSNAVNYAILFRKPIIFLTSADIDATSNGQNIEALAALLGRTPLRIDGSPAPDPAAALAFDEKLYERYIREYIKNSPEEKPCWQIFADHLRGRR
jgi:hypothetical protein